MENEIIKMAKMIKGADKFDIYDMCIAQYCYWHSGNREGFEDFYEAVLETAKSSNQKYEVVIFRDGREFGYIRADRDRKPFVTAISALRWITEAESLVNGGVTFSWRPFDGT